MNTLRRIAIVLSLLACAGCTMTYLRTRGSSLVFDGPISRSSADAFIDAVKSNPVERLIITSQGGDVDSAIDIALLILEKRIDVEVTDYCLSSCANYIFPAGTRKYITGTGIVAWHGNIRHLQYLAQTGRLSYSEAERSNIDRLVDRETVFFAKASTDEFLCWFGKIEPYSIPYSYLLSKEDMELFGLNNLDVRADYKASNLNLWGNWYYSNRAQFISVTRERLEDYRPSKSE